MTNENKRLFTLSACLCVGVGWQMIYICVCLVAARGAREWHPLASFDCLTFCFCFKMCLMTAMRACRNAFAALQWNTESCQSGCETNPVPRLWQEFPIAPLSASDKLSDCNYICPNAKSNCFFSFPSETWSIMKGPIVDLWGFCLPCKPAELGCAALIMRFLYLSDSLGDGFTQIPPALRRSWDTGGPKPNVTFLKPQTQDSY